MERTEKFEVITISGCDVVEYPQQSITYKVKCERCGYVKSKKHTVTLTKGVTEVSTMRCEICGHSQMVKIRYFREN